MRLEYTFVQDWRRDRFIEKVNAKLDEGWKPQGGICSVDDGENNNYYQALVLEVK